jgi:hypothetical protein
MIGAPAQVAGPLAAARSRPSGLIAPDSASWEEIRAEMAKRYKARNRGITFSTTLAAPETLNTQTWGAVLLQNGRDILFVPANSQSAYVLNTDTETFTQVASGLSNGAKFRGGALHPNGNVYMAPFANAHIGSYNHATQTFIEDVWPAPVNVGNLTRYEGIVLTRDGNFIMMPHDDKGNWSSSTSDATYSIVGNVCTVTLNGGVAHGLRSGDVPGVDFVSGTAADKDDCIVVSTPTISSFTFSYTTANTSGICRLAAARKVCKVDPVAGAASAVGPWWVSSGCDRYLPSIDKKFKCEGTALGPGAGTVVGAPLWENDIPEYHLSNGELVKYGNFYSEIGITAGKFRGGRLLWTNEIIFAPYGSPYITLFDPFRKQLKHISFTPTSSGEWTGVVAGPDGLAYLIPRYGTNIGVFDPVTYQLTTIAHGYGTVNAWSGGVLAPNGKIYCSPFDADHVLVIDTGVRDFPADMLLSAYLNHF